MSDHVEIPYQIIIAEIHRIVCQSNNYSEELNRIYEITSAATNTASSKEEANWGSNVDDTAMAIRDVKPIANAAAKFIGYAMNDAQRGNPVSVTKEGIYQATFQAGTDISKGDSLYQHAKDKGIYPYRPE